MTQLTPPPTLPQRSSDFTKKNLSWNAKIYTLNTFLTHINQRGQFAFDGKQGASRLTELSANHFLHLMMDHAY